MSIDAWRVFRIVSEFVEGFEAMTSLGPSVAFFGSALSKPNDLYYQLASTIASKISDKGLDSDCYQTLLETYLSALYTRKLKN
jgi:hypothetical protein